MRRKDEMHPVIERYLTELAKDATAEDLAAFREFARCAYDLGRASAEDPSQSFLDATAQRLYIRAIERIAARDGHTNASEREHESREAYDAAHALLAERTRRR